MQKLKTKDYIKKLLNTIFPVKCVCCRTISRDTNIICDACIGVITEEAMRKCKYCGHMPYLCRCKKIKHIEDLVYPFFYVGEKLKFAIYSVKKANLYYINEFFAKGMYNSLKTSDRIILGEIDFIAYIPRMAKSVRKYGYNQTKMLAMLISEYSGIPCAEILKCSRMHKTEQKTLSGNERIINVRDKFFVRNDIIKDIKIDITDKNILLIDDVATTGSTLSECAKAMKNAGANKIYALCASSALN